MSLIKVGISHGDINGISYEVILKTLLDNRIFDICIPILYGSSKTIAYYRKSLELGGEVFVNVIKSASEAIPKRINVINCVSDELKVEMGVASKEAGEAAFYALERATDDLKNNEIDTLLTAPINKDTIQSEKFNFPGHTEYLEQKFGAQDSLMFFVSDSLKIALVTNHLPICKIAENITQEKIVRKLQLLNESLKKDFMIVKPRIAVLALNPHAGDNGLLGEEEQTVILPAMKTAQQEYGIFCAGPFAADGFFGSSAMQSYDAVLAMYHDQALAPFKALQMDCGVNFTAGLPIVRTSPTHGTAYDKVGKNSASENSFRQALYKAIDIYKTRKRYKEFSVNPL